MNSQNNNLLLVIIISVALVAAAILMAPSSMLQLAHAQTSADFQNTILSIHNQERTLVNVPVLTWNNNLAAAAQTWANHLATLGLRCDPPPGTCTPPPHDNSIQGIQGENLWAGSAGRYMTNQQVQRWVNEKSNYVPGTPIKNWQPSDPVTGHYTQMVWRNTNEIGCAASSDGTMDFLVCRYSPSGNYLGQTPY